MRLTWIVPLLCGLVLAGCGMGPDLAPEWVPVAADNSPSERLLEAAEAAIKRELAARDHEADITVQLHKFSVVPHSDGLYQFSGKAWLFVSQGEPGTATLQISGLYRPKTGQVVKLNRKQIGWEPSFPH